MLQAMKNRAATWVIRVLAVLLIISFAAWGVGDMITGTGLRTDVADVGDTKITAQEFNASFRNQVERLRRLLGPEIDSEQARQLGVVETTLEGLISRRLLELYAHENGIVVGDDQIRQRIAAEPAFQGPAGTFDNASYQNALFRQGLSEQGFVEDLRAQIRLGHLTDVIRLANAVPDELAASLYRYRNDRRIARYVIVPRPGADTIATPSVSELSEFHRTQAARFTAPERRELTAIHLDPAILAKEIQPPENELKAEYESRLAALSVPERRRINQVVVGDEAKAHTARAALRAGRSIGEVATSIAGMDADATRLGLLAREDLPGVLAEAAFALPVATPSQPVKSPLGWHVLVVEQITPGRRPSFAEIRPKVLADLAREQAVDALVKLANQLEDALAGGASLEEAAAGLNTKLLRLRAVEANGNSAAGPARDGLLRNRRFLVTAFETGETQVSDLTETPLGGYFIVRVDRIDPPALEPFDKVRKRVRTAWRNDRLANAAKDRANRILDQVRAGRALDDAAKEMKLAVATTPSFTRFDQGEKPALPGALATELFRVKPGEAVGAPTRSGYAVAVLHRIEPADPKAGSQTFDGLRAELKTSIAADLLAQYTRSLRRIYPVNIDSGALDRLFEDRIIAR